MRDMIWICKNGRKLPVSNMGTRHIKNCLNLMDKHPGWREEFRERLELELLIRELKL